MRKLLLLAATPVLCAAAPAIARCPDTPPMFADATIEFEPGAADLRPAHLQELRDVAGRVEVRRVGRVCVYGTAGRDDGPAADSLALDRAEAVAAELRAAGVPMFSIEIVPVGPGGGLLASLGGDRRVDIVLEP